MALLVLLVSVLALVFFVCRSIQAGFGRLLAWLSLVCFGVLAPLGMPEGQRFAAQVFAYLWLLSVIGLPLYWAVRGWQHRRGVAS